MPYNRGNNILEATNLDPALSCRRANYCKGKLPMKDDKSRILPLLMDPRQPDENNRAYAYRILRKNIMNIQLQPGCQLSEAELF